MRTEANLDERIIRPFTAKTRVRFPLGAPSSAGIQTGAEDARLGAFATPKTPRAPKPVAIIIHVEANPPGAPSASMI
jgi:hypothetical protein